MPRNSLLLSATRAAYLGLVIAVASLTPCASTVAERREGVIVIAGPDSFPAAYEDEGKLTGYMVDVLQEAFRRLGLVIEVRLVPWARCLAEARAGRIDAIFPTQRTSDREQYLDFTNTPMFVERQAFFARTGSVAPSVSTPADYAELSLALVTGVSYGGAIDQALADGMLHLITRKEDALSLVRLLVGNRVLLIAAERQAVLGSAQKLKALQQIQELAPSIQSVPNFLAFTRQRDFSSIRDSFSAAMQSMISDGTYQRILDRYSEP